MSYSGRYANALVYNPGRQTGVYRQYGGPRNALAAMVPQPQDNPPFSVTQRPAAAPAAPTLSGGTGTLAGGPAAGGYAQNDGGASWDGEYGGPGPAGAPRTGNFLDDVVGFGRAAGPAVASMALGGPMGIASVVGGGMLAGALRAAGMETAANALARATFSAPFGGASQSATAEDVAATGETGGMKADTLGNVSADAPADLGKSFSEPADAAGTSAENTASTGETGGAKGDTAGDVSAEAPAFRYGGYTGDDDDGRLEPIQATLHEREFVLRPEAVEMYGKDFLHALNRGQLPRNALAGNSGRRVTAANHLLQRMRG